jgi:hypothetical protein
MYIIVAEKNRGKDFSNCRRKIDDIKDRSYEELEQVFNKFPKYHIKNLLGDFNAKVGREDICIHTIGS